MDKWRAIDNFWNSFGIPAYDENSVPEDAVMPYITYNASTASFEQPISLNASIYYKSTSWTEISQKADQIAEYIGKSYLPVKLDDGYLVITKSAAFSQRLAGESDSIRRMYILIDVEFYTEV